MRRSWPEPLTEVGRMRSGPDIRRLLELAVPTLAAGALIGLLSATWTGLWQQAPTSRLALVAALGVIPAIVHVSGIRRAALWSAVSAVVVGIVILGAAVGSHPGQLLSGDDATWSALGEVIPSGLGNAAATPLPLSPDRAPALSALLTLVLAGASCLIAWQLIVARRPLAGIVAAATGLAYRWTLVPPLRPVLIGVVTLVIALAVFRLAGPRRTRRANPGRTALAGSLVVALALVGSLGADRAPASWWDWREWTFGTGKGPTSLSLRQSYGPLTYPDAPVLVARVEAGEPIPLRAVSLDAFDGTAFVQSPAESIDVPTRRGRLNLEPDRSGTTRQVTQKITIGNARTPWLLAGGRPLEVSGVGRREVTLFDDDSVRLRPSLTSDASYELTTLVPDPGPAALAAAGTYSDVDPELLTIRPGQGASPVRVPAWTASGPPSLDADAFGQYAGVYRLSQRIIGDAKTPYAAVNRIETYLWKLRYDVSVPRSVGTPDIANFLLVTKRGYCQHFAGAMALMLRMNGIPARVAVGFTSDAGRFDREKQSYEIIDRDAHSWVEVDFPGYGWIPFDPTPGRSVPNSASRSSPAYEDATINVDTGEALTPTPVTPPPATDPSAREPRFNADDSASQSTGTNVWRWLVPLALVGLVCAPFTAKLVRRRRRRRGDERRRALGAVREFEALLVDLGHPPDPAATPHERAAASWRALGLDAAPIYAAASAARFNPADPRPGLADDAWRAVTTARRALRWRTRLLAGLRLRSLRG